MSASLPTPEQMLNNTLAALMRAMSELSDARDWLNSDWPPGCKLTAEQAAARTKARDAIAGAKNVIAPATWKLREAGAGE